MSSEFYRPDMERFSSQEAGEEKSKAKNEDPTEDEKSGISRRDFLKTGAAAAASIFFNREPEKVLGNLEKMAPEKEPSNSPEALEMRANVPDILEMLRLAPNAEYIRKHSLHTMSLRPGGYSAPLDSRKSKDIFNEAGNAYYRNLHGTDPRSISELALVSALIGDDKRFEFTQGSLKAALDSIPDKRRLNEALREFKRPKSQDTKAVTAGDLMFLLQVLGSRKARKMALQALFLLQQNGDLKKYGLHPLDDKKIIWAGRNKVSWPNLAWAEAMEPLAKLMLTSAPEIWFDALSPSEQNQRIAHIRKFGISNPGAIAMLEHYETFDMEYIGDVPFMTQINEAPGQYPTAEHDMHKVAEYLQDTWRIPYLHPLAHEKNGALTYEYIPGSQRGRSNASGGAVFGQFMPINLDHFIQKYEASRIKLKHRGVNLPAMLPGSPWAMSLLKYLYLNADWHGVQGHGKNQHVVSAYTKGGYVVGNSSEIAGAIKSWNPFGPEIRAVVKAGNDYYQKFRASPHQAHKAPSAKHRPQRPKPAAKGRKKKR